MGQSKGGNMVGMVRFLRKNREAARQLLPENLQHYLNERIDIACWYPEEDAAALLDATATLLPQEGDAAYTAMGRFNAHEQLDGTYRHLVGGASVEDLPRRIFAMWSTNHDTGEMRMEIEEPGRAVVELSGFTHTRRGLCLTVTAYIEEALKRVGAKGITVRKSDCKLDGSSSCRWQLEWQA